MNRFEPYTDPSSCRTQSKPRNPKIRCSCRNREREGRSAVRPDPPVNRMSVELRTEWPEGENLDGIPAQGISLICFP
jgi:hypothetical protein